MRGKVAEKSTNKKNVGLIVQELKIKKIVTKMKNSQKFQQHNWEKNLHKNLKTGANVKMQKMAVKCQKK